MEYSLTISYTILQSEGDVLILILMEYSLTKLEVIETPERFYVLILILMEYSLTI